MICSSFLAVCLLVCASNAQPISQAPVVKEAPKEVLFRLQKPFELNCEVEGDASQVKYEWNKNNAVFKPRSKVEQREGKLIFNEAQADDEGQYQCFAVSPAGKASSRSISVKQAFLNAPKVQPQTTKPVEGKPFKLACPIPEAYPKPTIEWKKKKTDGNAENVFDGRITFSDKGDLYFTNATEEDVSKDYKYVCLAKSPAVDGEVLLAEHTVEPLEKNPSPDHEVVQMYVTPDQHTIEAGQQAFLYCIYGGSPQAYPDWFKDGVNVNNKPSDRVTRHNRSKGKRLLIKEVLLEDEGQYTCVINNELGKEQKYSFNVKVVSAPKFSNKPSPRIQAKEGDDVFIPCEVQAKPNIATTWTYNAAAPSNSRVSPSDKGLRLTKVQKSDSGYYGCAATNDVGGDYVETLLQVV